MVFPGSAVSTVSLCIVILAKQADRMKLPEELQFIANARKEQKTTQARMDGKVVVITGATSGVGYHAVRRLAHGGARLVMVSRNQQKAAQIQHDLTKQTGAQIHLVQADFSDLNSVRQAAAEILEQYPRIDVLINNAGIHNTHRELTPEGIEKAFYVNHLASFLFTRLLLDRLKENSSARILQINSQGHRFGGLDLDDLNWSRRIYKGLQGYGASKVAQLLTVWELAEQLQASGVTINAMHPGAVKSNIGMNNGLIYRVYKRYFLWWFLKTPKISGDAIYYLVAAPEMDSVNGRFFNLTIDEKPARQALDREVGKRIWAISEEWTGLK